MSDEAKKRHRVTRTFATGKTVARPASPDETAPRRVTRSAAWGLTPIPRRTAAETAKAPSPRRRAPSGTGATGPARPAGATGPT